MSVKAGDRVQVRTAHGEWLDAIAHTAIEGTHRQFTLPGGERVTRQVHDFPVIWVKTSIGGTAVAWPAEDVREFQP